MEKKINSSRIWILFGLILAVGLIFGLVLIEIQIVHGQAYSELATKGTTRSQTIQAARGEITDRYGRPLVQNEVGYNITLDKAYLTRGKENEIILRLLGLLSAAGDEWIDKLPVTEAEPFAFRDGQEAEVAKLKDFLNVGSYTNVEDVMSWLVERYGLEGYTRTQQRQLAGIRYEMERQGFSISAPYTLAENVEVSTVIQIKERSYELSGVMVVESTVREYAAGDIAPHLVGQIGPIYAEEYAELKNQGYAMNDTIGKSGIEEAFESALRGENGKRTITLNSNGEVIDAAVTKSPVPGNSIMLTLDIDLQRVAQDTLAQEILWLQANGEEGEGREASSGAVVAIECKTGEILAMASYPTYNLATYNQDYNDLLANPDNPLFNRALQGTYAPGSIFKPLVGTAGLQEGLITPAYTYTCNHVYTFYEDYQPRCLGWHPNYTVMDALRVSCNIFFYDLGRRLGIDTLVDYARQFGLGEPTGIELPEALGHMSSPSYSEGIGETWNPGDVLQASIGQGKSLFTPLQLATYVSTLANGGVRMKTHLVKSIKSYNLDQTVEDVEPEVMVDMNLSDTTVSAVRDGMIRASGQNGYSGTSGAYFGNYAISVASKTGTPETTGFPNGTYICYAPADDPEIAVAVVIENGYHGYWGAAVAKAIFDEYFFGKTNDQIPTKTDTLLP
ncbi:MAG: penicillin-binding transpeptidase domain-containing protein [Oscillospiraceae bacterium]|nr:penicillin-binding transpeptidase domain-containing protein [Oscillospiraceae bacterium]